MSTGTQTLLVAAVLYAALVTVWNVVLMWLLDIAKSDVRRLNADRQPVKQAVTIVESIRTRRPAPAQRRSNR